MTDNSTKATVNARILAIVHVLVGLLLVCLGVVDLLLDTLTGNICMGILIGLWVSRIGNSSNADICCLLNDANIYRRHDVRIYNQRLKYTELRIVFGIVNLSFS